MNNQARQKIKNIYQLLFEMAAGNLTFRFNQETEDHELDELKTMLNAVADKMELLATNRAFINPYYTYQGLVQATITLDKNFTITGFCTQISILLEYSPENLFKLEFDKILAKQSIPLWDTIIAETAADVQTHAAIQLLFITSKQQLVPCYCTVSRLLYSNAIIISFITTKLQDILPETTGTQNYQSDAVFIQNVRAYILKNLDTPLPSTSELSKIFNVNEFKLKDTFRHFCSTSIYQFYIEERLKKAHLLILQTAIPLKEIAFISGYNDYTNFYKAFKKRYNYSPSDLKRHDAEGNNTA
nr:helix-turn-helix domain-containing protein [uncultured Flavobacterium sp.]